MESVALTDTNGLYGLIFFLRIAAETGIRPIIGTEIVTEDERAVLLVKDRGGYHNLCKIITQRHCEKDFSLSDSLAEKGDGLVVLSDTISLLERLNGKAEIYGEVMTGRCYRPVVEFASGNGIPLVATSGAYFLESGDYQLHRLLRAIDLNTKLSRLMPGATAPPEAWLMPQEKISEHFPHIPDAIANTEKIREMCRFRGDLGSFISPGAHGTDRGKAMKILRRKCESGARQRYGTITREIRSRLEYELKIIEEKGFADMFLVVDDIVKRTPICCGRGSAAASIVSYCLGITHVDPIKNNLYFERFLNPERRDPPDIDLDFAWDERDRVLNYIFKKYGGDRSAMVANHTGFRPRSAVREVAKVYGMPERDIKRATDRLAHLWRWRDESIEDIVANHPMFAGFDLQHPWPEILRWATRLQDIVRHISVHCGGVVIVPDCISRYVPVEKAPKGVPILQWEKDQTEDSGLAKIDLLGNRSLAVIRDTLSAIRRNSGRIIDYERFDPIDDPETQRMIASGDTMGVFYIESPAMRQLQKKTRRGDYEHLVIHSSIIRPAANNFINEYVRRLRGMPYRPIHPILDKVLKETYGIMVYQEDVTKIAIAMAGFSARDGDGLRKTLSKKRSARQLSTYREMFFSGARNRGVEDNVIERVWEMILSFGGYSFCKPHSASYALVSFKSAYLRAHYPAEFMAAVMSNQGGYYTTFAYISEARRMGLRVLPPDINESERKYIGKGREIRMGLMQLKGLRGEALDLIIEERNSGPYVSFENFLQRTDLDPSDLRILIKAGCFDSISGGRTRAQLLWQIEATRSQDNCSSQMWLDLYDSDTVRLPNLGNYDLHRMIINEVEVFGFPLSVHPLDLYGNILKKIELIPACHIHEYVGKRICVAGWWITNKLVYTKNDKPMAFISFEDQTSLYETILFPDIFKRYCSRFTPVRPYILKGMVVDDMGAVSLRVEEMVIIGKSKSSAAKRRILY